MSKGIEWLRNYLSPERWSGVGPDDDYQIFGDMRLSDLRALEADIAAVEAQCRALVEDAEAFRLLATMYSGADFDPLDYRDKILLHFVAPDTTRVSKDLRATLKSIASPTPEPARDAE